MSDHTPPEYWDNRAQAQDWLVDLLSDTENFGSWTVGDTDDLCDEVFDTTRSGWTMMIVLRKPFRRDPGALLAFAEEFLTKRKGRD